MVCLRMGQTRFHGPDRCPVEGSGLTRWGTDIIAPYSFHRHMQARYICSTEAIKWISQNSLISSTKSHNLVSVWASEKGFFSGNKAFSQMKKHCPSNVINFSLTFSWIIYELFLCFPFSSVCSFVESLKMPQWQCSRKDSSLFFLFLSFMLLGYGRVPNDYALWLVSSSFWENGHVFQGC